MKKLFEIAEEYLKKMTIWDMALVKICLLAMGILVGLAIPKRCKKGAGIAAAFIFAVTYVFAVTPFLKTLEEKRS